MIKKLSNNNPQVAEAIHQLFQLSYAVEAELLEAQDFPPLKRPVSSYESSKNAFYGYIEEKTLAGIIEVEHEGELVDINSLVVSPLYFRQGIGRKLLQFVFQEYGAKHYVVETGVLNTPAITLYKKLGFIEVKQWDTDFGIRKVLFERYVDS